MSDILKFIDENKTRYEEELKEFLRIPSISTSPEHKGEVRRCAEFVRDELLRMGLNNVKVYETAGHPVVYGDVIGVYKCPLEAPNGRHPYHIDKLTPAKSPTGPTERHGRKLPCAIRTIVRCIGNRRIDPGVFRPARPA